MQQPPVEAPKESNRQALDSAISDLSRGTERWTTLAIADRLAILRELIADTNSVAAEWVEACRLAEGLPPSGAAEEWMAGPYLVLRNLRQLEQSLSDIERLGEPRIPGPVERRADGQVVARVFPQSAWDRLLYAGVTAEVWMQPDVDTATLADTQAVAYKNPPTPAISLVLGAGNVSSIGPMDFLYKLFVDQQVVLLKMHPVNAYLGPLFGRAFQALIDWRALRVVYGGAEVGDYLCQHPQVDDIHITGSDKTVEAIVFGTGEAGRSRQKRGERRNHKPITSELGNVSPVIVVPGPWTAEDLAYHGRNLASMLTNNAGFNCNAARVVIQHEQWQQRTALVDQLRLELAQTPLRQAYYPGAEDRYRGFAEAYPQAEELGQASAGELPWMLIPQVDNSIATDVDSDAGSRAQAAGEPGDDDEQMCFRHEAFCGVIAETALDAVSTREFLRRAVELCNDRLWGTLNATLLVHPKTAADADIGPEVEQAIADLRYGTVAVNCWAAVGYGLGVTTWGAFPGHEVEDIQSGCGVVHNTLMFDRAQKSVVRAPFRMSPTPMWFNGHRTASALAARLTAFEAQPSTLKLPGIFAQALRG